MLLQYGTPCLLLPACGAAAQVVLFAVPGAFTPTCSLKHLPGFIEKVRGRAVQLAGRQAGRGTV